MSRCWVRSLWFKSICEGSDNGHPVVLDDSVTGKAFMELAGEVIDRVNKRNKELRPTIKVKSTNEIII
jgi:ATP-binding protein involved in chromosome partitioning